MQTRLYRTQNNAVIAGVCSGLGQYLGIDPVLVRIFFLLFTLAGGAGPLVYLLLWVIVPREDQVVTPASGTGELGSRVNQVRDEFISITRNPNPEAAKWVGVGLLVMGFVLLLQAFHISWLRWLDMDIFWPGLLIVAGGLFLWRALKGGRS